MVIYFIGQFKMIMLLDNHDKIPPPPIWLDVCELVVESKDGSYLMQLQKQ